MRRLTDAQMRALRLVVEHHVTRITDLRLLRVSRATISALDDAGALDTRRFPGTVYATDAGYNLARDLSQPTPTTEDKGREDRAS